MNNLLRILDHGGKLDVQETMELYTEIRKLQYEVDYWKAIAEDRKHLLNVALKVEK